MHRQPLGKVSDRRLRPGVGGDFRQWGVGVHGADIEDVAAGAAHHLPCKRLGGDQRADEVQVKHKLHAGFVQVEEALGLAVDVAVLIVFLVRGGPGIVAPRAVEQDIAGANVGHHRARYGVARLFVQHVAAVGFGNAALGGDFVGILLGGLLIQVQQGYLRTRPGQHLCERGAQHAARAGDHCHLPGEIGVNDVLFHRFLPPYAVYPAAPVLPPWPVQFVWKYSPLGASTRS